MDLEQQYFERWVPIREAIQKDSDLLARLRSTFETLYQSDRLNSEHLNSEVLFLNNGTTHVLFHIGSIILPNQQDLHLALRLRSTQSMAFEDRDLAIELSQFGDAFALGLNPPYFVGAVKSHTDSGWGYKAWGMLTEDLTERRTLTLKEQPRSEFAYKPQADGSFKRYFIDPSSSRGYENKLAAAKYIATGVFIEL